MRAVSAVVMPAVCAHVEQTAWAAVPRVAEPDVAAVVQLLCEQAAAVLMQKQTSTQLLQKQEL